MTTSPTRRRHAARRSRLAAGALSTAATVGLMGSMAVGAASPTASAPAPSTATVPTVVRPATLAASPAAGSTVASPTVAPAPRVARTSAPPVAQSHRS
jgi:hypothetical protein